MIRFWLNDAEVSTALPAATRLLDYLRGDAGSTGTRDGCREGECGSCAVLLGRLADGQVRYRSVTSCLVPLGEVGGHHVVTIEGLTTSALSPVQAALLDEGAVQCGFCTSGIVVSLTSLMLSGEHVTLDSVRSTLSGHLCRCTGYRSLVSAGLRLSATAAPDVRLDDLVSAGAVPAYFREMPARLRGPTPELPTTSNDSWMTIAGGTDVYVRYPDELPSLHVEILGRDGRLGPAVVEDGHLAVDALTTFEEFASDPTIESLIPEVASYMQRMASSQVRSRATIGGNIVNASPAADTVVLLLALNAVLEMAKGGSKRILPLSDFFLDYKRTSLGKGEIVSRILIPIPDGLPLIHWQKVSRRPFQDIASVNSAVCLQVEEGTIRHAAVAFGGVAPTPLLAVQTAAALVGRRVDVGAVMAASDTAQREVHPISDPRGSAVYKRLLVRQQLVAHFLHLFPGTLSVRMFDEAL